MKRLTRPLIFFLLLLLAGIPARAQWTTQWQDTSSARYQMTTMKFSGATGYAGCWTRDIVGWATYPGILKTTDGGQTWDSLSMPRRLGPYQYIETTTVLNVPNPDTIYIKAQAYDSVGWNSQGFIGKSTDGGLTWSVWHPAINTYCGATCFVSATEAYVIVYNYFGVWIDHTTDDGVTWTHLPCTLTQAGSPLASLRMDANGNGLCFSGNKIYHTTDGGQNWTTVFTAGSTIHTATFTSSLTGYAFGCTYPSYDTYVYKTTNGGLTWSQVSSIPHLGIYGSTGGFEYGVDFLSNNAGYLGGFPEAGYSNIYLTVDGGVTWTPQSYPNLPVHSQITAIAQSGNRMIAIDDSVSYHAGVRIYTNTFSTNCSVSAGNDTTFCQQQGQLHATPGTPGNYLYSWSPSTGLSDPTVQNPFVNHVYNQQYVVTMTDTVTNCIAQDTIVISAYEMITGPQYNCYSNNQYTTLDFGPGASNYYWQTFTDTNNVSYGLGSNTQTLLASSPGYYLGFATFPGCGSITSYVQVIDSCYTGNPCTVDAGPDTVFCQQHGQLMATPGGAGVFSFVWSPATGLDNPYIQNPTVISGVANQTYTVTMTNLQLACIATDTVTVSAYYFFNDTIAICNNSNVTLDFGPGGSNYTWQAFTDTAGNTTTLNIQSQTLQVTQQGSYMGIASFPTCGALTSVFTVIDSCNVAVGNVWPGDCNYDLTANMADALHIGLGYGATGATRPNATPLWYAQPMNDWAQNFVNCNYKHADADGNGTIDVNDTLPIWLNYGNTHPFRLGAPEQHIASAPDLYLVANYDTVGLQTLVTVDIRLGRTTFPVDSIYGISFRITADSPLIDTTMTDVNLGSTWLGTPGNNMFHFRKEFPSMGVIDIAECGNNHVNRLNGNGSIGSFLIVTTDNLSGIAVCHFHLSDITAVTTSQEYLLLNTVNDSVVIDPSEPAGIHDLESDAKKFSCYPNPAGNFVTVQTNTVAEQIEICDMTGRVLLTETPESKNTVIDTAALSEGIYLVRVRSGNSVATQKLTITH